MKGNREYRSDVFSLLMEDKRYALQVYNALNGTEYTDQELVEICPLAKGVSLTVRNDAAIVVDASLNLYEHQTTVCPNMPLRLLIYVTKILKEMTKDQNLFGRRLIKIPMPKFVVFYNGTDEMPEEVELRLSDAYERNTDTPELELVCKVYNINLGKNEELLNKCSPLKEYMTFVDYVRIYKNQYSEDQVALAINCAIDQCIRKNVLADFLTKHREEITKAMELDLTFERQIELERNASMQEGMETGKKVGMEVGKKTGQMELLSCIKKLKEGLGEEKLLQEGYERETIERAKEAIL